MNVSDLIAEHEFGKNKLMNVYNPLDTDFSVAYDRLGADKTYTVGVGQIKSFKTPVAKHILKHLLDAVLADREVNSWEEDRIKEIKKELSPVI